MKQNINETLRCILAIFALIGLFALVIVFGAIAIPIVLTACLLSIAKDWLVAVPARIQKWANTVARWGGV